MRDVVRQAFYRFNAPFEGEVPWLYQDVKGLVSIGVGILCDPISLAANLPLVHPDGRAATKQEIVEEWMRIKSLPPNDKGQTAAQLGHLYARPHAHLRLTKEGLEQTLTGKLTHMDRYLAQRFPEYGEWPADAQLATLSMAWACGPAFRFPKLEAALRAQDFLAAANECHMDERGNPGLIPRNRANKTLYRNAAFVKSAGPTPDRLYYPTDLFASPPPDDDTGDEQVGDIVHKIPDTVPGDGEGDA